MNKMNNKARSFVTIMIVAAVSVVLLRFTVDQFMKRSIAQNEAGALSTLKLISAALENYSRDNHGVFPVSLTALTRTSPVYLDRDYIKESPIKGYTYACSKLDNSGYNCTASPLKCKVTGRAVYNISTGGLFVSEGCKRED